MAEVGKVRLGAESFTMDFRPGEVLSSQAGRDGGFYYLCLGPLGPRFLALADGTRRTATRPKKKNIRHLVKTGYWDEEVGARLTAGEGLDDREIRGALQRFQEWRERRGEDGQRGNH